MKSPMWPVVVIALIAASLIILAFSFLTPDEDEIPMPPPGYEYCAIDDSIGFCREGDR